MPSPSSAAQAPAPAYSTSSGSPASPGVQGTVVGAAGEDLLARLADPWLRRPRAGSRGRAREGRGPRRRPARPGSPPRSRGRRPRRSARSAGSRPAPRGTSTASPGSRRRARSGARCRCRPGSPRRAGPSAASRASSDAARCDRGEWTPSTDSPFAAYLRASAGDERQRPDAAQLAELEEVDEQRGPGREALADRLLGADPGDPGREGGDRDVVAFGAHRARIAENAVHRSGHVGMLAFP